MGGRIALGCELEARVWLAAVFWKKVRLRKDGGVWGSGGRLNFCSAQEKVDFNCTSRSRQYNVPLHSKLIDGRIRGCGY